MAEQLVTEKKNITVFGTETEFDGVLEFTDKVVITGKFNGKIIAPEGNLGIAKNAVVSVENIETKSVQISGNVSGNILAKERVEICSGSVVSSDITTNFLRIANNVEYSGQVTMLEKEPDIDLFSVSSNEFKQALLVKTDRVQ